MKNIFQLEVLPFIFCLGLTGCSKNLLQGTFNSSTPNTHASVDCQATGKATYFSKIEPYIQQNCVACHASNSNYTLLIGSANANANYQKSLNEIYNSPVTGLPLILSKISGKEPHGGGTFFLPGSTGYNDFANWIQGYSACSTITGSCRIVQTPTSIVLGSNGSQSNLTRASGLAMLLRLQTVFPNATSAELNPAQFSLYNSTGINTVLGSQERPVSAVSVVALQAITTNLCKKYSGGSLGSLFSPTSATLPGETLPTDSITSTALVAARNGWLYPYKSTDDEVQTLVVLYNQSLASAQASGANSVTATANAQIGLCTAIFMAPQFALGNRGPFDYFRRVSLEVAQSIPTMQQFSDLIKAATSGSSSSYLSSFVQSAQNSSGYIKTIENWHRGYLGLSPDPVLVASQDHRIMANNGATQIAAPKVTISNFGGTQIAGAPAPTDLRMAIPNIPGSYTSSELCDPQIQNFDPRTTQVQWQQYNAYNSTWETVGSINFDLTTGQSTVVNGSITLTNGAKLATSPADIAPSRYISGAYVYLSGNLSNSLSPMKTFTPGQRRVLRYSPSGLQNGYSPTMGYYSGKTIYACNAMSRFLATCVYRPISKDYVDAGSSAGTWNGLGELTNTNDPTSLRVPRPKFDFEQSFLDSLSHPVVLSQFHCGIPNPLEIQKAGTSSYNEFAAYPMGYSSLTAVSIPDQSTINTLAANYETDSAPATLGTEGGALSDISNELFNEPFQLLDYIVQNNIDYRQLVTANYSIGSDYLKLYYLTHGYRFPVLPPGYSRSSNPTALTKISSTTFQPLPISLMRSSLGAYAIEPKYINSFGNNGNIPAKPMSGILTQVGFLYPVSGGSYRTLAARILDRAMCGQPNTFIPNASQTALQSQYIPPQDKASHLQPSCIQCHINLDPLATAIGLNFWLTRTPLAANPTALAAKELSGEVELMSTSNFATYGVTGAGGNPSTGALLGQEVTGIQQVGQVLGSSNQFARCTVGQAFQNIFGRMAPAAADCASTANPSQDCQLIQKVTSDFMTSLGYNYNKMIEDLVISTDDMRAN